MLLLNLRINLSLNGYTSINEFRYFGDIFYLYVCVCVCVYVCECACLCESIYIYIYGIKCRFLVSVHVFLLIFKEYIHVYASN